MWTDAKVEMRNAEGHREIAVQHADMGRRMRRSNLPGGPLDQRAEGDFVPVLLEQIPQQLFQAGFICRQWKDLDGCTIGIGDGLRGHCGGHSASLSWFAAPARRVEGDPDPSVYANPRLEESDRVLVVPIEQIVDSRISSQTIT